MISVVTGAHLELPLFEQTLAGGFVTCPSFLDSVPAFRLVRPELDDDDRLLLGTGGKLNPLGPFSAFFNPGKNAFSIQDRIRHKVMNFRRENLRKILFPRKQNEEIYARSSKRRKIGQLKVDAAGRTQISQRFLIS